VKRRPPPRLVLVVYLVIGFVLAGRHHYLDHLGTIRQIASAALAVALWPLLLLGIDLHIRR
jgi:hypothetical protein